MLTKRYNPIVVLIVVACGAACSDTPTRTRPLADSASASLSTTASSSITATPSGSRTMVVAWSARSNPDGYEVYRGSTPTDFFVLVANTGPNTTSFTDQNLSPRTQYCYEVREFSRAGRNTKFGAFVGPVCATTPAPQIAAPTNPDARPMNTYLVRFSWQDNSSNETGFRVERSSSATGPWSQLTSVAPNTTFADLGADPEVLRCYRVVATNLTEESDPSAPDCTVPPLKPAIVSLEVGSGTSLDVAWFDNSQVEDGFEIERQSWADGSVTRFTVQPNVTRYHDTTVAVNTRYTYRVRATRDGGGSNYDDPLSRLIATEPPSSPPLFWAMRSFSDYWGVDINLLNWQSVSETDDGFRVERSLDGGTTWEVFLAPEFNVFSYEDLSINAAPLICYRIFSVNNKGASSPSLLSCV